MGRRRGCLAAGLGRSTVCYYCLGGCSAPVMCARSLRQVRGVRTGAGSCFSPWAPPCPRVRRGGCYGVSRAGVPSLRLPIRHSMRSVRSAGLVRLPFGSAPRLRCVCVCARAPAAYTPPPPGWCGARPTRGSGAGRRWRHSKRFMPLRVSCPGPVLHLFSSWRGLARSLPPPAWLWVARPLVGGPVRPGRFGPWGVRGGGRSVCRGEFCFDFFYCTFEVGREVKGWVCRVLYVVSSGCQSGVLTRILLCGVWEKIDAQDFPSSDGTHGSHRP